MYCWTRESILASQKIAIWNPKFCHKNINILPQEIGKFATFFKLSLLIEALFFVSVGPEYNIYLKMHTKGHPGAYHKVKWLKTTILYQNKSTKTSRKHQNATTQDIHENWNCSNTRTPKPLSFRLWAAFSCLKYKMEKDLNQGMCPQRVRNLVQGKRTSATIKTSDKDNSVNLHAGETESRQNSI